MNCSNCDHELDTDEPLYAITRITPAGEMPPRYKALPYCPHCIEPYELDKQEDD